MKKSVVYTHDPSALDHLLPIDTEPSIRAIYECIPEMLHEMSFGFEEDVVLLDLETTGLDAKSDRITEVALTKMNGPRVIDSWSSLVNPQQDVPAVVTAITGITNEMLEGAPTFAEISDTILEFIGSCDLIAHNANFDRSFLNHEFGYALKNRWLDSIYMARIGMPRLLRYSQPTLAAWLNPEVAKRAHRAAADVEVLCDVWRASLCGMYELDFATLAQIADLPVMGCGGEHAWIRQVLGARTDNPGKRLQLRALRQKQVKADSADALADAESVHMKFPVTGDVMDELEKLRKKNQKRSSEDVYEDFELRDAQKEMANAVYQAFMQRKFLSVEAATGVGKSLAYLLPAALVALENDVPIGIATRSNTLTDQLLTREIPRLNKLLGEKLRFTAVKGYENYLCLRKIEALVRDNAPVQNISHLLAWISQSPWGDVGRISMSSRRNPAYIATQQECTNKKCRFYPYLCYLHGTRRRALSSHLVVTNHSLLFRDAMSPKPILPPIRYWVVDEAHSVEKEARDQLSTLFDIERVAQSLRQLTNRHGGLAQRLDGLFAQASASDDEKSSLTGHLHKLHKEAEAALKIVTSFGQEAVELFLAGGDARTRQRWISLEVRESAPWLALAATGRSLFGRLEKIEQEAERLSSDMQLVEAVKDSDLAIEASGFAYDMKAYKNALGIIVGDPDDNLVYSVEKSSFTPSARLIASPLEVGSIIDTELYGTMHSLVYTSATMTVAHSFSYFSRSVGLDRVEPSRTRELSLASSYELEKQMKIFVINDMPDPREARYLARLSEFSEELHRVVGGGVLSLFTNRRDMEGVFEATHREIERGSGGVLLQREGASSLALAKEFIEHERMSLMALRSFWEGFDAKGDTLRCVFIPKLPFAMPGTPLALERNFREGHKAWSRYDLPEAIIDLRQAIGRLIRSSSDRGYVVLGDSRLVSKSYGKRVLSSLPVEPLIAPSQEILRMLEQDQALFDAHAPSEKRDE